MSDLYIRRARDVARRLRSQANQVRCGDNMASGEKLAGKLEDEAYAIEWHIKIAESASEGERANASEEQLERMS